MKGLCLFARRRDVFAPRNFLLWIALASVLAIAGCDRDQAVEVKAPVVTVAKASEKEMQNWDEYTGRLASPESVEIRSRVSGYLTEIKFKDGDVVKKGQPLFYIDKRPYQADYDQVEGASNQANAAASLATIEYKRAMQLREKGAMSAADFDLKTAAYAEAVGKLQTARSAQESARLNLEFCTIVSPIEGKVSKANVTVGNLVSADGETALTTVVSIDPIHVYVDVDEQSFLRYVRYHQSKKGAERDSEDMQFPIQLGLQDEEGFPHTGVVDFVDNQVDPSTGTIQLRGRFANEDHLLVPGFYARIKIPSGDPFEAVLVPQRAIGSGQGQKYVVSINQENVAALVPVKIGREVDGLRIVTEGLSAGETVVVDGLLKVQAGAKVDPQPLAVDSETSNP